MRWKKLIKELMVKVKEQLQKNTDKENEMSWSFAEWMDYFSNEPTSKELDDMEREHKLNPINNQNYHPLQGA